MDEIKSYKLKNGNILKIYYDTDNDTPREWNNIGVFVFSHKRYDLPNEINFPFKSFENWEDIYDELIKRDDVELIYSVRGYDHSGFSISLDNSYPYNDRWDSGQIGYILITKESLKKARIKTLTAKTKKKIVDILKHEIRIFNQYMNGEVYGFIEYEVKECNACKNKELININSCWGYYDMKDIEDEYDKEIVKEEIK